MVHISTSRRAEIVIFGKSPWLIPPFTLRAGAEFFVSAAQGDTRCTVSRYQVQAGEKTHKQCTFDLEDVLRTLATLGSEYPDVVEFLRQVQKERCITCEVKVDALPVVTDVKILAAAGGDLNQFKQIPELEQEIQAVQQELGITPTLQTARTSHGGASH
jgi:hypothetical protein